MRCHAANSTDSPQSIAWTSVPHCESSRGSIPWPVNWLHLWLLVWSAFALVWTMPVAADDWPTGEAFTYRRVVDIGSIRPFPRIVVTEFYAHGTLSPGAANLAVFAGERPVPWKILQAGRGDYCRVALQTTKGETVYHVYYGGKKMDQPAPKWTVRTGLLLETRRWKGFDLNRLESLQAAFSQAEPIGSDYVRQVFHSFNPLDPTPQAFLSCYRGELRVANAGKYSFFTSSQDCSFLLIDGKQVVAAPGRHRAVRRARIKGDVELTSGAHRFEYWHAASGSTAVMVAAWQPPRTKQPQPIPPDVFGTADVFHFPALHPEHRLEGRIADFTPRILGEVTFEGAEAPLIRVRFEDIVTRGLVRDAKVTWDFGDGQTHSGTSPEHIYLRPGRYKVTMTVHRRSPMTLVNEIDVGRPAVVPRNKRKPDQLERYVPVLLKYDASKLNGDDLCRLVTALAFAERNRESVAAARAAFAESAAERYTDAVRYRLAMQAGRILRDQLDDAEGALALWKRATELIGDRSQKAACAIEAIDTAVNFVLRADLVVELVEAAGREATRGRLKGERLSKFYRVRGDWEARNRRGDKARVDYERAMAAKPASGRADERSAWRGAYSRSVEAFLREGKLPEARRQLDAWLADFPIERTRGYHSLLLAQYWAAAGKTNRAIATAFDSLQTNPASAYADQLLNLVAKWEEQRGRTDLALAAYRSLVADYPGSPLVPLARREIERIESSRQAGKKE